jgi:hypothetical protein
MRTMSGEVADEEGSRHPRQANSYNIGDLRDIDSLHQLSALSSIPASSFINVTPST